MISSVSFAPVPLHECHPYEHGKPQQGTVDCFRTQTEAVNICKGLCFLADFNPVLVTFVLALHWPLDMNSNIARVVFSVRACI